MGSCTVAVQLDLRRDLPKVREQWRAVSEALGQCHYTAPCVVGAMVPKSKRGTLEEDRCFSLPIGILIANGRVVVPDDQRDDFTWLQNAFDKGDLDRFERTLAAVEQKYLAKQEVEALLPDTPSVWVRPDAYVGDRVRIVANA